MSGVNALDREDQLAGLYGRWKESAAAGSPTPPEEICATCPELLDDFRDILPKLAAIDALFDESSQATNADYGAAIESETYRSLSFYKEGGLGVVLVGEDAELGRRVALKCLKRRAGIHSEAAERFIQEAEITARLEHPGIVPVYRIGRDANGRPFYVMRFVQGETLGETLARFHQTSPGAPQRNVEFRRLLRSLISVCETLAFAHSRQVIHRDVKPENIILGPFGETLLLDWGLAKSVAPEVPDSGSPRDAPDFSRDGVGRSVDGRAKGSPAFMSPEQARGDWERVRPASDIYSLGATLYTVLTGRLPYSGPTSREVIEQVKAGRLPRPRQHNALAPKPLEAICLKAMAYRPEDRYASAQELARDLELWLADEPVSAWHEPLPVRARRWIRRHRAVVMAGVTALFLITAGAIAFAVREKTATTRLAEAHTRLRQLVIGFQLAEPTVSPDTRQALDESKAFFKKLAEDGEPKYLFELAALENTDGVLRLRSNDSEGAMVRFVLAEQYMRKALAAEPLNPELKHTRATILRNLAATCMLYGNAVDAVKFCQQSAALLDELRRDYPGIARLQVGREQLNFVMAAGYDTLGSDHWKANRVNEALANYEESHRLLSRLSKIEPQLPEFHKTYELHLRARGEVFHLTAQRDWEKGDLVRSLDLFEKAEDAWVELAQLLPPDEKIVEKLDRIRLGIGFVTQARLKELNLANPQHAAEARRILTWSTESLDAMTPKSQSMMTEVRTDLGRQLQALPAGGKKS